MPGSLLCLACALLPALVASLLDSAALTSLPRITQSTITAWRPIRIKFDFSLVTTNADVMVYLQSTVFGNVQKRLQAVTSIRDSGDIPPFSTTNCQSLAVPEYYKSNPTIADLVIFVKLYNSNDRTIASSAPCAYAEGTARPRVGVININLSYLKWGADHIDATISTMLHETLHIMIISPSLYGNYRTPYSSTYTTTTRKSANGAAEPISALSTAGLLNYAREYFACPNMTGVFLENQGTSTSQNSHWNKLLLGNELMTSQRTGYPAFSFFTYHLMSDSGWYQMDFTTADATNWGRYAGCDFVNEHCNPKFKEFCTVPDELSCSVDYRSKTICTVSGFTPGCYYNEYVQTNLCSNTVNFKFTSPFEEPGSDSRCFNVKINGQNTANCYRFECTASGVSIRIQGVRYVCNATNQTIQVSEQLTVVCPNINDFCNVYRSNWCPNDCNGQGTCSAAQVCKCNYFYTGVSCETKIPCQAEDKSICHILERTDLPLINDSLGAGRVTVWTLVAVAGLAVGGH